MGILSNNRDLKNFFINPKFQARMIYYFVGVSFATMSVMVFILNRYLNAVGETASNIPGISYSILTDIYAQLNHILLIFGCWILVSLTITIVFGIVVSHRIAGPMYAIINYIRDLKAGKYDSKRPLRPYDELIPIMNELHELADELNKKKN